MSQSKTGLGAAIGFGALAGTCALTFIAALDDGRAIAWEMLPLLLTVVGITWSVAAVIVALGMLLFAWPLTALLRKIDCEDAAIYALSGALAGLLVPVTLSAILGGGIDNSLMPLAISGSIAGGTAGAIWGIGRERLAKELSENARSSPDRGERWLR